MNKPQSQTDRRAFLQTAAAAATFHIVPRHVLGGAPFVAPSEKINIGLVGAGGQGRTNARQLFPHADAQITAIADPAESFELDRFYYKGMGGRKPVKAELEKHYQTQTPNHRVTEYGDYRQMLEKERSLDAILCATPDHLHAHVSVMAMRAGKHVFCEKPLTHNIWEARLVARVARETGVATQMGNIGHSTDTIRETVEWLRAGAIGTVREVHAWVGAGRWNPSLTTRPTDTPSVPPGLDWDLWLGPRMPRPFHTAYFPVAWRDFWEFGGSNIGDFGCHDLDSACWALDLTAPTSIEFHAIGPHDGEIGPHGSIGRYEFAARGPQQAVSVTWYDGGGLPPRPAGYPLDKGLPGRGVLFIGDQGSMLCGGAGGPATLFPASRAESFSQPSPTIPRSKGHHRDWLDACKGGPAASSDFVYGARLTELALLGVLSLRMGRRIEWDSEHLAVKGIGAEAEPFIREPYRSGWEL